ncbi:AtpZ/AtpI family protein [Marinactinospora thermotolerans]|uniref:ATP synthase protein I n=1 Tax=Marinactinospora thermotolerans DSM 45154 TaxID=1122192 RepID=A0A1T4Q906_9ACTN|nr:AtpZ/AtpI family protein [Marinactinospora thermotolerans]SKA00290.1 ATP synthase protein I [Marinactinospora thermotolerans DSM 45154]
MSGPRETPGKRHDQTPENVDEPKVDGMHVVSLLMSGMIVWGGAGWLLDRLTDHQALFLPIGLLLGMGLGLYMVFLRLHPRS